MKDLENEVKIECDKKYGKVVHIAVDHNTEGDIYVKFDSVTGGDTFGHQPLVADRLARADDPLAHAGHDVVQEPAQVRSRRYDARGVCPMNGVSGVHLRGSPRPACGRRR